MLKLFDTVISDSLIRIIKIDKHIINQIAMYIIKHADFRENIDRTALCRRIKSIFFNGIKRIIQMERDRLLANQFFSYLITNHRIFKDIDT